MIGWWTAYIIATRHGRAQNSLSTSIQPVPSSITFRQHLRTFSCILSASTHTDSTQHIDVSIAYHNVAADPGLLSAPAAFLRQRHSIFLFNNN